MPATQSQSTQVKPPKWPGRCWVMRYEALPGCCRRCDVRARVQWSTLNLPGPRDPTHSGYSRSRKLASRLRRCDNLPECAATAVPSLRPSWGKHLDLSRQRIHQLVDEHVIVQRPNGRFDQDNSRWRYLRWLRDPTETAIADVERLIGIVLTQMSGMGAGIGGHDLRLRRRVDEIVYETRVKLTDTFKKLADEAREPPLEQMSTTDGFEEERQE